MRVLPPPAEDRDDGLRGVEIKGQWRHAALGAAAITGVGAPGSIGRGRPRAATRRVSARGATTIV